MIAISYLELRLKQLLRLLTGVGLLRCLFLFLFLFLIFLLLIKVDRDWIVPAMGIGGLFFYHNERKDKDFLLISTDCAKSILSLEYLLLSFPFVGIALFKGCFLGSGFIVMAALLLPYMKSLHLRLPPYLSHSCIKVDWNISACFGCTLCFTWFCSWFHCLPGYMAISVWRKCFFWFGGLSSPCLSCLCRDGLN